MTVDLFRFVVVVAAATIAGCLFLVRLKARRRKDARYLELVLWSEFFIVAGYLLEHLSTSLPAKIVWDSVQLGFDGTVSLSFVLFAAQYTGRPLRSRTTWSLLAFSAACALFFATSPWHGLARTSASIVLEPMPRLTYDFELLDFLAFLEMYALFFIGIGLFVQSGFLRHRVYLFQISTLIVSIVIPVLGAMMAFTPFRVLGERDFAPFFFTLGAMAAAFGLLRARVFELSPLARDLWIEQQRDAILVVDAAGLIVDANPAAEGFVREASGLSSAIGVELRRALPAWAKPDGSESPGSERVAVDDKAWELRRFQLKNVGWLLVGRDISSLVATERALARANHALEERVARRTRELSQANDKFRAIFDNAQHFISLLGKDGYVLAANRATSGSISLDPQEAIGRPLSELAWWRDAPQQRAQMAAALTAASDGRFARFEAHFQPSGRDLFIECSFKPVLTDGVVELIVFEGQDVTEARQAERKRARESAEREHGERMEMLGRLAGGIAHDFNNLLTIVLAATSMLRQSEGQEEIDSAADDIEQAAASATLVTRQLLALSRRGAGKVEPTDVHAVVERMSKLLDRLLGERHQLRLDLAQAKPFVLIDGGQLEQCIMNLVINARDAMPSGGTVTVQTRVERIEGPGLSSGDYLTLSVEDHGSGISDELRSRIFEAFFTTKPAGQGTGLGLSTVHSIVTAAHGTIDLKSRSAPGSTFELRFPLCDPSQAGDERADSLDWTGTETVALVEDVSQLRELMGRELRRLGYDVHTFSSAEQALENLRGVPIALLITDVILPGRDGVQLAELLRAERGAFPVVYTTGYSGDAALDLRGRSEEQLIVYKPYRPLQLARAMRELLDGSRAAS